MDQHDDFYEEDEPVADVVRAFEEGERGVTAPPESDHRRDVDLGDVR